MPRLFMLCLVTLLAAPAVAQQGRKPNVLLILTDDLGYAELGCYGQAKITTPNIDKLAAGGMRFTQYYSGSPVCAPSRCVLLTGKHSGHAYIRDNREMKPEGQEPLAAAEVTIAEALKQSGYATGAVGKWGLGMFGSEGDPLKQGFDHFFGYNCQRHAHNHYPKFLYRNAERFDLDGNEGGDTGKTYAPDLMEAEALKFIRDSRDKPFFLYFATTIPHLALQVPEDSLKEYQSKWEDPAYDGKKGYRAHAHPRAAYAAMISRMDRGVGRMMALLRELKLENDTLVIFVSDNGPTYDRLGGSDSEFFGSAAKFRGLKGSVYEGGIRVPLIVSLPGRIKPGVSDLPAVAYDLLPTICSIAGAEPPAGIDGLSLVPTLTGQGEQKHHEFLYWEFPSYGVQQAVRLGDFKGVRQKMTQGNLKIELYNLAADLSESKDISAENPQVVERIRAIMDSQHTPTNLWPLKGVDRGSEFGVQGSAKP